MVFCYSINSYAKKISKKKSTKNFPKKAKISFKEARTLIIGTLALISIFAVLGIAAHFNESWSKLKKTEKFNQKLTQVATLSLEDEDSEENEEEITIFAVGDILPARFVELKMRRAKNYKLPFERVADILRSADVTFGNLESPLMDGLNVPRNSMTFRGDPEAVQGFTFAGFDVLSIANNHTMNYQTPGLTSTIQHLKKANILACGGGKNQDAAHTPSMLEVKGKKIAFYCYVDDSIPPRWHGIAKVDKPGIARANVEVVKNDVKNALKYADIVIVSMHAGAEYKFPPTQFQKDFAHAAIDAGASAVIGHHPHVIEPVEKYGNGVIFYSLGNFVFDQFFSPDVQTGLVAKITFDKFNRVAFEVLPVKIDSTQPRFTEGEEKEKVLKKLGF